MTGFSAVLMKLDGGGLGDRRDVSVESGQS